MTSLLRNSYNGRAPSSPQKSRFPGTPMFVIVIYSKQTAGEGGGFAKSNEEGLVDLSLRVDERSAKEQNQTSERENKGGYELCVFHLMNN